MILAGAIVVGAIGAILRPVAFASDTRTKSAAPYASAAPLPKPRLFAEGVISTPDDEIGGTFTPDGRDFYFARRTPSTISSSLIVICVSHFRNGRWSKPEIAPFSGRYTDFGPSISPDGSRLYFSSVRPVDGVERQSTDIWFVERTAAGPWGEARNIGAPINTANSEQHPSVARDGTIYFTSDRPNNNGRFDIYRSRRSDGKYLEPEKLGDGVNTADYGETHPFIAPDQSYLLFASVGRPDSPIGGGSPYPRPDLYVSFNRDGQWTAARRLPAPINTDASEAYGFASPDGRYLFFTSERNFTSIPMKRRLTYRELESHLHAVDNGMGNIYQIDWRATGIEEMKSGAR